MWTSWTGPEQSWRSFHGHSGSKLDFPSNRKGFFNRGAAAAPSVEGCWFKPQGAEPMPSSGGPCIHPHQHQRRARHLHGNPVVGNTTRMKTGVRGCWPCWTCWTTSMVRPRQDRTPPATRRHFLSRAVINGFRTMIPSLQFSHRMTFSKG